MKTAKSTKKRNNHTRDEIIKKTVQIIQTEGLENFTLNDLLTKMNIAVGTFYYYFESKEELLFNSLIYSDQLFLDSFNKKYRKTESAKERLCYFLHEQSLIANDFTAQYLDNYWHIMKTQVMEYYFDASLSPKYQLLISIIADGQASGEFHPVPSAKSLAELVWTAMAGTVEFSRMSSTYSLDKHVKEQSKTITALLSTNALKG